MMGNASEFNHVRIVGSGFVYSSHLRCKFGSIVASAAFVSSNEVICNSPPNKAGVVDIAVSNNGVEFSSTKLQFYYREVARVTSIWPTYGKVSGGTTVILNGEGLTSNPSLVCRFGTVITKASMPDLDSISCASPSSQEVGTVTIDISVNGIDFTSNGLSYEYIEDAVMISISPALGPTSGGTLVTINGFNFRGSQYLGCKFGEMLVEGRFVAENQIECRSPPHEEVSVGIFIFPGDISNDSKCISLLCFVI